MYLMGIGPGSQWLQLKFLSTSSPERTPVRWWWSCKGESLPSPQAGTRARGLWALQTGSWIVLALFFCPFPASHAPRTLIVGGPAPPSRHCKLALRLPSRAATHAALESGTRPFPPLPLPIPGCTFTDAWLFSSRKDWPSLEQCIHQALLEASARWLTCTKSYLLLSEGLSEAGILMSPIVQIKKRRLRGVKRLAWLVHNQEVARSVFEPTVKPGSWATHTPSFLSRPFLPQVSALSSVPGHSLGLDLLWI